jgi:hypothetical protein
MNLEARMTVDEALASHDEIARNIDISDEWIYSGDDLEREAALATEVRRLRVALAACESCYETHTNQLRARIGEFQSASAITAVNFGKAQLEIAQLQTEVGRLRAQNEKLLSYSAESQLLRFQARAVSAEADLTELHAKLARVEALPEKWDKLPTAHPDSNYSDLDNQGELCADELREALREPVSAADELDPQPSAVPTPKSST